MHPLTSKSQRRKALPADTPSQLLENVREGPEEVEFIRRQPASDGLTRWATSFLATYSVCSVIGIFFLLFPVVGQHQPRTVTGGHLGRFDRRYLSQLQVRFIRKRFRAKYISTRSISPRSSRCLLTALPIRLTTAATLQKLRTMPARHTTVRMLWPVRPTTFQRQSSFPRLSPSNAVSP